MDDFARTRKAVAEDRWRPSLGLIGVLVVLLGWVTWSLLARVSIHVSTDDARLEAAFKPHPVESPVDGAVQAVAVSLGERVEAGQLLFRLEAGAQYLQLAEEQARLQTLEADLVGLGHTEAIEFQGVELDRLAAKAALSQAASLRQEAEAKLAQVEATAARRDDLLTAGLVSSEQQQESRTAARRAANLFEALSQAEALLQIKQRDASRERRHRLGEIKRERALLEGEIRQAQLSVKRRHHELDRYRLVSPVAGDVGSLAQLEPGSTVAEGDRVATIIPEGVLVLVGWFSPSQSQGRIVVGQTARMELGALPWIQHGALRAEVFKVAQEPQDGRIRVELQVSPGQSLALVHGMTGRLEIEVERIPPMLVVVRSAGRG